MLRCCCPCSRAPTRATGRRSAARRCRNRSCRPKTTSAVCASACSGNLRSRRAIQQSIAETFATQRLDALLAPTVPAPAQRRDQLDYDFDGEAESVIESLVRTTAPFNLAGLPAVAVPTGVGSSGLPGSVQIVARPFDEPTALRLARVIERGAGRSGPPPALEAALATPV